MVFPRKFVLKLSLKDRGLEPKYKIGLVKKMKATYSTTREGLQKKIQSAY